MTQRFARTIFWIAMAGLAWLVYSTIFAPLRVVT